MQSSTLNILIVESNPRQTEIIVDLINEVAFRPNVDTTNSPDRSLELVSRSSYQLVVMEAGTGKADGVSVLERIKSISPSTSVIMTSNFATIEEAVKAVRLGADEYFKKPFNPEQFKLAVRRALDRRDLFAGDEAVVGLMNLLNCCQLVSGCLEEDKIFDTVLGYLKRETHSQAVACFVYKHGNKKAEPQRVALPNELDGDVVEVMISGISVIQSLSEENVLMKILPKAHGNPEIVVFRFSWSDERSYYVVCASPSWAISVDEVDSRVRLLQSQIQMTARNIDNYRDVQHLLNLDEPTGLFNTRYLHKSLEDLLAKRKIGEKASFSVLFLDVDKFKSVNDQYGHLVGTKLLYEVGQIVRGCLRPGDLAFRYGGDEFVVILKNCQTKNALDIAERLRANVEKHRFLSKEKLNVNLTVSIGVANCPDHATTKRAIIEAADSAMYAAKRTTRNRVYVANLKAA